MDGSVRIWFSHQDAFGQFRLEPFQCFFKTDEDTGASLLSKIRYGKIELPMNIIAQYNKVLPVIASLPMDLNYPSALPDSIGSLQLDIESARKINLSDLVQNPIRIDRP
jgi:hypothetical protein